MKTKIATILLTLTLITIPLAAANPNWLAMNGLEGNPFDAIWNFLWGLEAIVGDPIYPTEEFGKFDMGGWDSPLQEGWTCIDGSGSRYTSATGYGWRDYALESACRPTGSGGPYDDVEIDCNWAGAERTFSVNVTDGNYTVSVWQGDWFYSHLDMYIYAEGELMAARAQSKGALNG